MYPVEPPQKRFGKPFESLLVSFTPTASVGTGYPSQCFIFFKWAFVTINGANEVLGDPDKRREYDLEVSMDQRHAQRGTGGPQQLDNALRAEKEFDSALTILARGEYAGAEARLQAAAELGFDGEILQVLQDYTRYLTALAQNQAGKLVTKKAPDGLLKFVSTSEAYPHLFLFLGRIYKLQNDLKTASAFFKKAMTLRPNLNEAASEYRYAQRLLEKGKKGFLTL